MKTSQLIFAALLIGTIANSATVSWNAYNDTGVIGVGTANSAPALAVGNWVQIGYFQTLTDTQIANDAKTVAGTALLAADFYTFASLQISAYSPTNPNNSGVGAAGPGGFQQTTSNFLYSSNTNFVKGSQIYIWALNSTNNTSLSTAEASVTQQAIAYVPLSITTPVNGTQAWAFPGSDISSVSIDITSLQTPGSVFDAGGFIKNANNTNLTNAGFASTNNALQLAPVPEPTALAFCGMAIFSLAGMRRRRSE